MVQKIACSGREERRKHLLFELLRDREPRKLYYYSEMLGVSETTVANDMEVLGEWFSRNNLEVIRRPGYGVVLSGSEADYREAMRRFIHENGPQRFEKRNAKETRNAEAAITDILLTAADSGIYSLLNNDILVRVYNILSNMDEPMLHQLAENALTGLAIHIAIAIDRVQKGAVLEAKEKGFEDLASWEGYDLAARILREMEEEFQITIPGVELSYILLHLRGSKIAYSGTAGDKKAGDDAVMRQMRGIDEEKLLDMIDEMIEIFNPSISYELKCDEDFVRGLLVHLRPVIVRLFNHMNIFNPILKDIREEYPDVFRRCAKAAKVINSVTERERLNSQIFPEMGFCLLHCRTDAVTETVFVSCSPRGNDKFTDPALKGISAAVMMLMPIDDNRRVHSDVLGRISGAFIKNEAFLHAVQQGTEDEVRTELTHELRLFFTEYVEKL